MIKVRNTCLRSTKDPRKRLFRGSILASKHLLALTTALFWANVGYAQETNRLSLPSGDVADLSNSSNDQLNSLNLRTGTRIARGNIGDWKDRLAPEFINLIRAGKMVAVAQDELPVEWPTAAWRLSHGLESHQNDTSKTGDNSPSSPTTGSTTEMDSGSPYPFGSYEAIDAGSSTSEKANKVLANINSIFASHGFLRARTEVLNYESGKLFRGYKFLVERLHPKLVDPANSSTQVFREKLTVLDPSSISGLSWLTFRFSGADEDLLFHYSPFAKKSIQLSGPNRLDNIAGTSLALDDLLTWSGKPEMLNVSSVDTSRKFFPLNYEKILKITERSGSCATISKDQSAVVLNSNHAQADLADWAPLNIPFVERETITLNLSTTDFHNPIGKVVMQVDLKTFLPLTKSYYDRSGNLVKFVFSIFSMAEASSRFNFTPLASFIIEKAALTEFNSSDERAARMGGKNPKTSDTSVVLYRSDERCSALPADMSVNDFDLKGFGIKVSVPQEAKSALNKSAQDNGTQGPEKTETPLSPSPSVSPKASQTATSNSTTSNSVTSNSVKSNTGASNSSQTGARSANLDNTSSDSLAPQKPIESKKEQEQEPAPDND